MAFKMLKYERYQVEIPTMVTEKWKSTLTLLINIFKLSIFLKVIITHTYVK